MTTVHILEGARPLCNFTGELPNSWPQGHKWVRRTDSMDCTCLECHSVFRDQVRSVDMAELELRAIASEMKKIMDSTVVVITGGGAVLRTFIVPTAHINNKDKMEIQLLAAKYNQTATLHNLPGFMGIEALKWEIRKMNGE